MAPHININGQTLWMWGLRHICVSSTSPSYPKWCFVLAFIGLRWPALDVSSWCVGSYHGKMVLLINLMLLLLSHGCSHDLPGGLANRSRVSRGYTYWYPDLDPVRPVLETRTGFQTRGIHYSYRALWPDPRGVHQSGGFSELLKITSFILFVIFYLIFWLLISFIT